MDALVSTGTIAGIVFSLAVSLGIPVLSLAALVLIKRKGLLAGLIGAAGFFLFAMVLEQLCHMLVLPHLMTQPFWYGVYGCLAAGIFEETARFVGLSFLCRWRKKSDDSLATAVGYGIGHGGIEAILVSAFTMISTLIFALGLNNGTVSAASMGWTQQQFDSVSMSMQTANFWTISLGGFERLSAMAVHMALSILMWMVVTRRVSILYYPLGVLLHAFVNIGAVMYQTGAITNLFLIEAWIALSAAVVCLFVRAIYSGSKRRMAQIQRAPLMSVAAVPAMASVSGKDETETANSIATADTAVSEDALDEVATSEDNSETSDVSENDSDTVDVSKGDSEEIAASEDNSDASDVSENDSDEVAVSEDETTDL